MQDVDIKRVTLEFDERLAEFESTTAHSFEAFDDRNNAGSTFRRKLLPFLVSYSRLVMFSFGFQRAFQQGQSDESYTNLVSARFWKASGFLTWLGARYGQESSGLLRKLSGA